MSEGERELLWAIVHRTAAWIQALEATRRGSP